MPPVANTIVYDRFSSFPQGMNAGVDVQLLEKDTLAYALNATLRGYFLTNRPAKQDLAIDYTGPFDGTGIFQNAGYYRPDVGQEALFLSAGGKQFLLYPQSTTVDIQEITIPGDPNDANIAQAWSWQAENYLILQNNFNVPFIYDGQQSRRANQGQAILTLAASQATAIPAVGNSFDVTTTTPYNGAVNIPVTMTTSAGVPLGTFQILSAGSTGTGYAATLFTIAGPGSGVTFPAGSLIQIVYTYNSTTTGAFQLYAGIAHDMGVTDPYNGVVGDSIQLSAANGDRTLTVRSISSDGLTIGVRWGTTQNGTYIDVKAGQALVKLNPKSPSTVGTIKSIYTNVDNGASNTVQLVAPYTGGSNQAVQINGYKFTITKKTATGGTNTLTLQNKSATGGTLTSVYAGGTISLLTEIPIGRMGAYILGRIWMSLPDGISFIACDQVGGSSGTFALQYRDAVLHITENSLLGQGGAFRVPGSAGDIRFFQALATLDASLGQGPVQVGTPNIIFSCNASQDRTTWLSTTNPILTESVVTSGGLSQTASCVVNSDLFYRSNDGVRSLILARREFATWGNTPQSDEVREILLLDDPSLLPYCSMVYFDNRLLTTTGLVLGPQGTYGTSAVVINFDPVSGLRGKAPSIYDGIWDGLNVLQFVKGMFNGVERCFAFTYSTTNERIELIELLPTGTQTNLDNGNTDIVWGGQWPVLLNARKEPDKYAWSRLEDGEIYVKDLQGAVTFKVWYRPDYSTTWQKWRFWTVEAGHPYEPRMGLGQPQGAVIGGTDTPSTIGYGFQLKVEVTGHAFIMGGRLMAVTVPEPSFASPQKGMDIT
jgi:hypothetical protein